MTEGDLQVKVKAGVVAWRLTEGGEREVLLISSRMLPKKWILPSGTWEMGESLTETAARECEEESGIVVSVGAELTTIDLPRPDKSEMHRVTYFLAEAVGELTDWEQDRERVWAKPAEALDMLTLPPMRRVLELALPELG